MSTPSSSSTRLNLSLSTIESLDDVAHARVGTDADHVVHGAPVHREALDRGLLTVGGVREHDALLGQQLGQLALDVRGAARHVQLRVQDHPGRAGAPGPANSACSPESSAYMSSSLMPRAASHCATCSFADEVGGDRLVDGALRAGAGVTERGREPRARGHAREAASARTGSRSSSSRCSAATSRGCATRSRSRRARSRSCATPASASVTLANCASSHVVDLARRVVLTAEGDELLQHGVRRVADDDVVARQDASVSL